MNDSISYLIVFVDDICTLTCQLPGRLRVTNNQSLVFTLNCKNRVRSVAMIAAWLLV